MSPLGFHFQSLAKYKREWSSLVRFTACRSNLFLLFIELFPFIDIHLFVLLCYPFTRYPIKNLVNFMFLIGLWFPLRLRELGKSFFVDHCYIHNYFTSFQIISYFEFYMKVSLNKLINNGLLMFVMF